MPNLKKFLSFLLCFSALFAFAACQNNHEENTEPEKTLTFFEAYDSKTYHYKKADEYLRANGYPESFIANTGYQTKCALSNAAAVFENETSYPTSASEISEIWNGFSCSLTVSDVSDNAEYRSKKYLTFNWAWEADRSAKNDLITLSFPSAYFPAFVETIFEIFGTGTLEKSYIPPEYDMTMPQTETGTFIYLAYGASLVDIQFTEGSVAFPASFNEGAMFRMLYRDTVSPEGTGSSKYTPYGEYSIDPTNYHGSFTVAIEYNTETNQSVTAGAVYSIADNNSGNLSCPFSIFT